MKKGFYNILKANFLVNNDAVKNWRFIVFCTVLAIVMIASSHSAERKVHQIAKLNNEVRELRSEFVERRSDLMKIKMESSITRQMASKGIAPSETPPNKIRVIIKE
ncbi:FtsL-like putative cell division protein [Gramella sp. AN32]|uniref:FtsL-like putative cell division protein n=1 Tax=Christiangramia antarctica TaxID=2058158 RepID=A0ABW5X8C5_9FLAO|nr:FtsL-like putative cell division protein [Gramella sp. AN32]MCM4155843.1 S-adenosyl-methyltransferase [Gramella sp. AN32]